MPDHSENARMIARSRTNPANKHQHIQIMLMQIPAHRMLQILFKTSFPSSNTIHKQKHFACSVFFCHTKLPHRIFLDAVPRMDGNPLVSMEGSTFVSLFFPSNDWGHVFCVLVCGDIVALLRWLVLCRATPWFVVSCCRLLVVLASRMHSRSIPMISAIFPTSPCMHPIRRIAW